MNALVYTETSQVSEMWLSAMRLRDLSPDINITIATTDTQSEPGKRIEQMCGAENFELMHGYWGKLDALRDFLARGEDVLFLEAGVLLGQAMPPEPKEGEICFGSLNAVGKLLYDCDEMGRWKEPLSDHALAIKNKASLSTSGQRAICCAISKTIKMPEYLNGSFGEGNLLGWLGTPKLADFTWRFLGDVNGRLNQQGMVILHRIMADYDKIPPKETIPAKFWDGVERLSVWI